MRLPLSLFAALVLLTGCCQDPAPVRFVPATSVRRAEVQPVTSADFQAAERSGDSIVATGYGAAWGMGDQLIQLRRGERLRVLTVNSDSERLVVRRLDEHGLATVTPDAVEALTSDYPH